MYAIRSYYEVAGRFLSSPISFLSAVNITRGMMTKGRPKLSTTWLSTRVLVGSRPMRMTRREGRIVMPVTTPSIKVDAVRSLGGEVVLHGDTYDDAFARATERNNFV